MANRKLLVVLFFNINLYMISSGCCEPRPIPDSKIHVDNFEGTIGRDQLGTRENLFALVINKGKIDGLSEEFIQSTSQIRGLTIKGTTKFPNITKALLKNYPKLTSLEVSHNVGLQIDAGAFSELKELKTLNLDYQKFPHVTKDIFEGLDLRELSMNNCNINSITADAFSNLPNLETLYLSYNSLTEFEPGTFKNLHKLKKLVLHVNKLKNINWEKFDSLPSLEHLDLINNDNLTEFNAKSMVRLFPKLYKLILPRNSSPDENKNRDEFSELGVACEYFHYGGIVSDEEGNYSIEI